MRRLSNDLEKEIRIHHSRLLKLREDRSRIDDEISYKQSEIQELIARREELDREISRLETLDLAYKGLEKHNWSNK